MSYITHRAPRGNIFPLHKSDKPILTAVPQDDRHWRLKAVSPTGEVAILPGIYFSRLAALGKAVLFAEQCGGEVRP